VPGIDILSADVEGNWSESCQENYDLVIMRHVLEHFRDPAEEMRKIHDVLSEDGAVYVAVPDMMRPKRPLDGYWFRPVHLYYFSEQTLVTVAARAGLEVVILGRGASEVWGVFKRGKEVAAAYSPSNYACQKRLLARYRIYEQAARWADLSLLRRVWRRVRGKEDCGS
jgi:2-polyprenyl-3-methyl-5-hydroxy-6-metoxy-1,4-benzoquinol methylase